MSGPGKARGWVICMAACGITLTTGEAMGPVLYAVRKRFQRTSGCMQSSRIGCGWAGGQQAGMCLIRPRNSSGAKSSAPMVLSQAPLPCKICSELRFARALRAPPTRGAACPAVNLLSGCVFAKASCMA